MTDRDGTVHGGVVRSLLARPPKLRRLPQRRAHLTRHGGLGVLLAVIVAALLGAWILPYAPAEQDLANQFAGPSWSHPLGTDSFGRDEFVRLVAGAKFSLGLTALALTLSALLGTVAGMLAGWRSGPIAQVVLSMIDTVVAIPTVIIALILVAATGAGLWPLVIAAVAGGWTPFARLAHQMTVKLAGQAYVEATIALGAGRAYILFREILPNAARPLLAHFVLRFPHILLAIAGLSFLGLGVQPPTPEWGAMLAAGFSYVALAPLLVLAPGAAIVAVTFGVGAAGRALERRWAPERE